MTYEYVCTECGHAWEAEQSISAAALKTCPKCGTDHAKRQVSGGAGFILKGGGWYADGYGSSKGGGAGGTNANPASTSSSSSSDNSSTTTTAPSTTETKTETPKTETPKTTTSTS